MVKDALGRQWQLGTIQVDYNLPERFDLTYKGSDNELHRPVMIHRAPFGSMERFVAILLEHTGGNFPLWLMPKQVNILCVSEKYKNLIAYKPSLVKKRANQHSKIIKNTSDHFDVIIKSKEFQLHPIPNEYHVKISGSLLSFVNLARKDSKDAVIDGSINFDGDVGVGQKYQKLIGLLKPDIEEELSHFVGDIVANNFSSFARATKRWAINSKNTFDENIAEYLQEETRIMPNKFEFNNFSKKISELRDDVERIEIRIKNSLNSR